jgi:hypothetical protein
MSKFEEWFKENEDFLKANNVSKEIALIVWDSAKTSAMMDFTNLILSGTLKVNLN